MKRTIRIAILTIGVVATFFAVAVLPVPAVADGGPIIVCCPQIMHCTPNLPPQ